MVNYFLSLLGRALGEPVVAEQRRDLVGVHQLPRHEGQGTKRHLFVAQRAEKEQNEREAVEIRQVAECGRESRRKEEIKLSVRAVKICTWGQLLQS